MFLQHSSQDRRHCDPPSFSGFSWAECGLKHTAPDVDEALLPCGQVVGLIHDIPSVKDIIEGIMNEFKLIGQRLNNAGLSA